QRRQRERKDLIKTTLYQASFLLVAPVLWIVVSLPHFPGLFAVYFAITILPLFTSLDALIDLESFGSTSSPTCS
ncbi:unnamed protein product, partial [Amoebophrya sp. A25]